MKKRTILYILAGIAVIMLILVLTKVFPPASGEDLSGTIGKVDRYRKVQMTEKDVILRSEFVSDTSLLANSIKGLMFFNAVIKQYSSDLQVCAEHLKINEPSFKNTRALIDYTKFIDKNVSSVENTIGLLSDFYLGDTTDYSVDIEKKLKDFNNFYNQIMLKDSVIGKTLTELENTVSMGIVNAADKKEGLRKLKSVHDQMLIRNVQLNTLVGNTVNLSVACNRPLFDAANLGILVGNKIDLGIIILNKEQINAIANLVQLGIFYNKVLGMVHSREGNNATVQNQTLGVIMNKAQLNKIIQSSQNLGIGSNQSAFASQVNLGIFYSHYNNALPGFYLGSNSINNQGMQQIISSHLGSFILNKLDNTSLGSF